MITSHEAIAREAETAASHIGIGVTTIGRANYAQKAYYTQAFFALSIGFERSCKLIIVLDHLLKHNGALPNGKLIRKYGHDLEKLLSEVNQIAIKRNAKYKLPNSEVHQKIINTLSRFADNTTRYYNLDILTQSNSNNDESAVTSWFDQVITPIWENDVSSKAKEKLKSIDRLSNLLESHTLVEHTSEQGQPINSMKIAQRHGYVTKEAAPYCRMYILQIARFIAGVIDCIVVASSRARLETIPYISEAFILFKQADSYFKRRKTWSIY